MTVNDPYPILMDQLKYPNSNRLRAVLEYLLDQDQAQIAAALPGTAEEAAQKTGFDTDRVSKELEAMFYAGILFPKGDFNDRHFYRFARSIMQLHDATQAAKGMDVVKDKQLYELWHDFVVNEWYLDVGKLYASIPAPHSRIVPAYNAIKDIPDMLPSEDFREVLKAQKLIAVVPCSCRYRTTAVGEHCAYSAEEDTWHCIQFGRAAEYALARGAGKKLSIDDALELMEKVEEDGLLHIWQNSKALVGANISCQCCTDCCETAMPLKMADVPLYKAWEKSRYIAVVDEEKCIGCQECVDRCHFDAVEMFKPKDSKSKKLKAKIDPETCYGCGLCVTGCDKANAVSMKLVRPPDHIPAAPEV